VYRMRKPPLRFFPAVGGVAIFFFVLPLVLGNLLGLEGRDLWILRTGFWALGAIAAFLVYYYLRSSRPQEAPAADDEIDLSMQTARKRLSSSLGSDARPEKLPLVLFMGPTGSTKTTAVVRSGLDPELLAGEVYRGDAILPTPAVNVWYAQGSILVEAGGQVLEDDTRWERLVRRIQPARLAAALWRGGQAPRAAVVCIGCDELVKPGASAALEAMARTLRTRLATVSERLGIRLPVYVLFTKADRIPHFADYVRSFSSDEAQEILGATLPAADPSATGSYSERESRRVDAAFQGLFHSLAQKRLDVLTREGAEQVQAGAYEFPREVRKLSDRVNRFLVELCKPRQLGVSPYLRGFYFTGVRSVIVDDAVAEAPAHDPLNSARGVEATSVFNVQRMMRSGPPAPPTSHVGRKVPEWVFLPRLMRDVVLADGSALRGTGGGTRVHLLRRSLTAAVIVLGLGLSMGFTVSYANNRSLQKETLEAARTMAATPTAGAVTPSVEELRRLDALREQLDMLARYERERRPWRLRWGLYTGHRIAPSVRDLYFQRFERVLWAPTRAGLLSSLTSLPATPTPTSDYGSNYDALKAHLITTRHPDQSTPGFLTPVLLAHWPGGRGLDAEREELVRRQFDFFGRELRHGHPLPGEPDAAAVARARAFLAEFADEEQVYNSLVARVSEGADPVEFHRLVPRSDAVLQNAHVVPGAFTRDGWRLVHERLADAETLVAGEQWVVGDQATAGIDHQALATELRRRYLADYVRHWQEFLGAGTVQRFSGADDAARKLDRLSDAESPLLQLLALASRHTAVDSAVAVAFQPLHEVVPPDADRFIGGANESYMAALLELQLSFDQLRSAAGPARAAAEAQAAGNAESANRALRQLAQSFSVEGAARATGEAVRRLLETPVSQSEGLLRGMPVAELNQGGRAFCADYNRLAAKYPFNPRATTEAELDEVAAMFEPGRSQLWALYDEHLSNLLVPRGGGYAAAPGAQPAPTRQFVTFFNHAADVSRGFFGVRGTRPGVPFGLRVQTTGSVEQVVVSIEGTTHRFTPRVTSSRFFEWSGGAASTARIAAVINGTEVVIAEPPRGPWAVFRMFQGARWEAVGRDGYVAHWQVPGHNLTLRADVYFDEGRPPVFRAGYLAGPGCVSQIAIAR
jgi:type VI secretion system protein ImpL